MQRPNIVLIVADDHAAHAISAYGSRINRTPHLDRIGDEGARFDSCFCTNSICSPSRASILTGTHGHVNGVVTQASVFDASQPTFPGLLRDQGYRTALFGKWHLGHGAGSDPEGFDEWSVLYGQGEYHDPLLRTDHGDEHHTGYVTDILTDLGVDWLSSVDEDRPFCLLLHHKAPHRTWIPADRHRALFEESVIDEPVTFRDDYETRGQAARAARMRVGEHFDEADLKAEPPPGLDDGERKSWEYQRYIKDYLRCVAAIDESTGRILDELERLGRRDDTIVIYTSDQGFFLGDHGWYDKRFIYEQSMRMPLLVRYPREIPAGTVSAELTSNVDIAQTILDWAGVEAPSRMQGVSLRDAVSGRGRPQGEGRPAIYYRYWHHGDPAHGVWAHYGIRTSRHKLVYFYNDTMDLPGTSGGGEADPYWELYDLEKDPDELVNVWDDPASENLRDELVALLAAEQRSLGDEPHPSQRRPRVVAH